MLTWIFLVRYTYGQTYNIPEITDCDSSSYLNYATLQCETCPENSKPINGLCACLPLFKRVYPVSSQNSQNVQVPACELCPGATSQDKFECIECGDLGVDSETGFCSCSGKLYERDQSGNILNPPVCESCAADTKLIDQTCVSCPADWPLLASSVADTCGCDNIIGDTCFANSITNEDAVIKTILRNGISRSSVYVDQNIIRSYRGCKEGRLPDACNLLANICILQWKDNTSCELLSLAAIEPVIPDRVDWDNHLPWIGPFREQDFETIVTEESIDDAYSFASVLDIVAAKYTPEGVFLGYIPITNGLLQLCKYPEAELNTAWSFAAPFFSTCKLSASSLWSEEMYFYELFLRHSVGSEETKYLFPIMVDEKCDHTCPGCIKQASPGNPNYQYTRRFFMVDTIGGVETKGEETGVIRVASDIEVVINYKANGGIFPPYLKIIYTDMAQKSGQIDIKFRVKYTGTQDTSKAWKIITGVIVPTFVIAGIIPFISWNRRNLSGVLDLQMLMKFLLALMNGCANSFLLIIGGFSFYWFVFAQSTEFIGLTLPDETDEKLFKILLPLGFVFKLISIIHLIIVQTNVDIFFIDWEREKPIADGDQAINAAKPGKISIWRTIFATNEWAEIQVIRKTSVELQLFMTIFFLEVVGYKEYTCTTPSNSPSFAYNCNEDNKRIESLFLRCGLALIVYFSIATAQYLGNRLIVSHFFNPINNFIDLLSVMNVSLFALRHRGYGFYVHGRSVHGRADTDMLDLQQCLTREANAQTGSRGLEPGEDLQTFEVQITNRFRNDFERCYAPVRGLGVNVPTDQQGKHKIDAYKRLNIFLQKFLLHGNTNVKYRLANKGILEMILDMEFKQMLHDSDPCVLYRDKHGESISNILFYGNELTMIVFDLLCFLTFDLAFSESFTGSYFISAAITFLIYRSLILLRMWLGMRNLCQKTLVDERFLI